MPPKTPDEAEAENPLQQALQAVAQAVADARDHADRAAAAVAQGVADARQHADRAEAAIAGSSPRHAAAPYIGAIVVAHTPETEIDGQHDHAAIVTSVDGDTINASLFRAKEGAPMAMPGLGPNDWDWPTPLPAA